MHAEELEFAKVPAGHGWQELSRALENVPALHGKQMFRVLFPASKSGNKVSQELPSPAAGHGSLSQAANRTASVCA